MPRPKTKAELLSQSTENLDKLNGFINSLSEEEQLRDFAIPTMNRNVRDVLAHLHHWHLMFLGWYTDGMAGGTPAIPAEGYNWRTLPDLNREIWKKYQENSLDSVKKMFSNTHVEVTNLVQKHSQEELFKRKKYPWTGNNAMAAYIIGVLSSHYVWALKLIKKGKKQKKGGN
ncbi:MAG: ClbS/DfsB family four-helix bundle protein [Bacteroidota bacterium]